MSQFYFFTDLDLLNDQTAAQAYGPVSGNENTQYSVTSLHTTSGEANAYAVCEGTVLVVPDLNDSNLVTVILKPNQQPPETSHLPFVSFYIYKGINKSSLIENGNVSVPDENSDNDLLKAIDEDHKKRWQSINPDADPLPPLPELPESVLGMGLTGTIMSAFFREDTEFQLLNVKGGWKIGEFSTDFGFEIMLQTIGYDPNLSKFQSLEHLIEVTGNPISNGKDASTFSYWHQKEEVLYYLDPCAFFGAFDAVFTKNNDTNWSPQTGDGVYNTIVTKFAHPDRQYIDIRNKFNYSFNYYLNFNLDNSATQVKVNGTLTNYYNNWPILILDAPTSPLNLQLPQETGTNPADYSLYYQGQLNVLDFSNAYTNDIILNTVIANSGTNIVAQYHRLKYLRHTSGNAPEGIGLAQENYLDLLFTPFDLKTFYTGANMTSAIYEADAFIDANSDLGKRFMAKIGIAKDDITTTFIAVPLDSQWSIAGETYLSQTVLEILSSKHSQLQLTKGQLVLDAADPTNNIDYLDFEDTAVFEDKSDADFSNVLLVHLDKDDMTDLTAQQNQFEPYRIYLRIKNKTHLQDLEGRPYSDIEISLLGLSVDANNEITIKEVSIDFDPDVSIEDDAAYAHQHI